MFDTSKLIPSNLSGKDIYWCDRALPQESPDHPKANVIYVLKSFSEKYELWSAKSDLSGYTPINAKHYNESLSRITPGVGYTSGETYEFSIVNIDSFKTYRTNATAGIQTTLLTDPSGATTGVSVHIDVGVTSGAFSLNDEVFYLNGIVQVVPTIKMPSTVPLLTATTLSVAGWQDGVNLDITNQVNIATLSTSPIDKTITFTPSNYGVVSMTLSGSDYQSNCNTPVPEVKFSVNFDNIDTVPQILPITITNDPFNAGSDIVITAVDDGGVLINSITVKMADPAIEPTSTYYLPISGPYYPINGIFAPSGLPNPTNFKVSVRTAGQSEVLTDYNSANPGNQLSVPYNPISLTFNNSAPSLSFVSSITASNNYAIDRKQEWRYNYSGPYALQSTLASIDAQIGNIICDDTDNKLYLIRKDVNPAKVVSPGHGEFDYSQNTITETTVDTSPLFPFNGPVTTAVGLKNGNSFVTCVRYVEQWNGFASNLADTDSFGNKEIITTENGSKEITVLCNVEDIQPDGLWGQPLSRNEMVANFIDSSNVYRMYFKTDNYDKNSTSPNIYDSYPNPRYLFTKTSVNGGSEITLFTLNESIINGIYLNKLSTNSYTSSVSLVCADTAMYYMADSSIFAVQFEDNIKFIRNGTVSSFNYGYLKDNVRNFLVKSKGVNSFLLFVITKNDDKIVMFNCDISGNSINCVYTTMCGLPRQSKDNSNYKLTISNDATKLFIAGVHWLLPAGPYDLRQMWVDNPPTVEISRYQITL